MSEYVMKITSKGQVTIPSAMRKELGVADGDSVYAVVADGVATIKKNELTVRSVRGLFPTPAHLAGRDVDELIEEATADHADWLMRQDRGAPE